MTTPWHNDENDVLNNNIEIEQAEIKDKDEIKIDRDAEYRMKYARISYNQGKTYKRHGKY